MPVARPLILSALGLISGVVAQEHYRLPIPAGVERPWPGPDVWTCRLQDWRLRDSRLECVEAAPAHPVRVAHLLAACLSPREAAATIRVRTGAIEPGDTGRNTWHGLLIGAGGASIDYRLTALVHHRPAVDGGLIVAVDGRGHVVFRDFAKGGGGGTWGIQGPLQEGEVAEIPASSRSGEGYARARPAEVVLTLRIEPADAAFRLTASASDPASGVRLSEAVLAGVAPDLVDGDVSLVSHLGPEGSQLGYWFRDVELEGDKIALHPERRFGPVLAAQYTLSGGILKLTAQMPPLGRQDASRAALQLKGGDGAWTTAATADLVPDSFTFPFRIDAFAATRDTPYRVVYELRGGGGTATTCEYRGTIRREPTKDEFVLAAFTGTKHFTGGLRWNHEGIWFPHGDLVRHVASHDPDFLFFSGDQIYEGDITGAQRRPLDKALLDYLDKWYRWCWAFGDLARDRPCVCIPDDHDVYHGNVWGAGGRHAARQDDGGYTMPPRFVDMVQRTQTSHLPDPYDPTPVEQGIGVYYTRIDYGGISFAVLEDRKWKSSPTVMCPAGNCVNGWFRNPDFDPAREADAPGAELLGRRQLLFLRDWATDWQGGAWMKVALSQTIFANVATLPADANNDGVVPGMPVLAPGEYAANDKLAADGDSNGWPQTGRNRALRELRRGFALHVAGDQHLGSTVCYGADDWRDAGYALCVPSIANTWPRRWFPPQPGGNRTPGAPAYTGDFLDGFGNHVTVVAVSNPVRSGREPARLHDRAPGYGIVRLRRASREIVIECWPRGEDPSTPDAHQYPGWPIRITQPDNHGREAAAWLPEVEVTGMKEPVVRVIDEASQEIVYALRIAGPTFRPKVFRAGTYRLEVGEPGTPRWRSIPGLTARIDGGQRLMVRF